MNILNQTTLADIDISNSEVTILTYQSTETRLVIAQVVMSGLVGAGNDYQVNFYIDNILAVPDQNIAVEPSSCVIQSRAVLVPASSTITIGVQGVSGDSEIDIIVRLIDASPASISDIIDVLGPQIEEIIIQTMEEVTVRPSTKVLGPYKLQKVRSESVHGSRPQAAKVIGPCKPRSSKKKCQKGCP